MDSTKKFISVHIRVSVEQFTVTAFQGHFFFFHFIAEIKSCIIPYSSSGEGKERLDNYSLKGLGLITKSFPVFVIMYLC